MREPSGNARLYRDFIQPQEHKIIFYNFRKKLPEVAPAKKIGTGPKPRGLELSNQTLIAESPNAKSAKQFIWQPVPKIELPRDVKVPNLIARATAAPPPPPPAEAPKKAAPRKAFVPPPATRRAPEPVQVVMTDAPNALPSRMAPHDTSATLKLRRTFLPPPPQAQSDRLGGPIMVDAPSTELSAGAARATGTALPAGMGTSPLAGIGPPNGAAGTGASAGNANADIAIAGLDPAGKLSGPLPDGVRPGRFSRAPELGEPSSGDGNGSGAIIVPGLSMHDEKPKPAAAAAPNLNRKAILYAETVRGIPVTTLSVPLRPSSRTIPAAIDARFQGRSVYTIVIPIENLPAYSGDWIVWFAERNQKPGDAPSMHAPLPFRKLEPVQALPGGNRVERRVQVTAVIKQDGTVDRIALVKSAPPTVAQFVIQDLGSWEFKPATRGGTPVDVDVVVEIPFNLSVEVASAGSQ